MARSVSSPVQQATTVVDVLVRQFFCRFGTPFRTTFRTTFESNLEVIFERVRDEVLQILDDITKPSKVSLVLEFILSEDISCRSGLPQVEK